MLLNLENLLKIKDDEIACYKNNQNKDYDNIIKNNVKIR